MPKPLEETINTLKGLQAVDDQLGGLREKVATLSLNVDEHKKRVAALQRELDEKTRLLKSHEKDSGMKELEFKSIQDKVAKLRGQLNTLKDNKQYTAMMHEINIHEAQSSRAEDQALELLDRVESCRSGVGAVRQEVAKAEEEVKREERTVADEVRDLSMQIRTLSAERQAFHGRLNPVVADKYDRIAHGARGKAVVAVKDGVCQGCFMGVTRQTISRLWAKKDLIYCPNCARIMYLEGEVQ